MDIVLSFLPELVTLLVAVGVAVARTTDNAIDDKVFKLAKNNKPGLVNGLRSLLREDKGTKQAVKDANKD